MSKSDEESEEDEGEPLSKVVNETASACVVDLRFRGCNCNPKGHPPPSSTCSQISQFKKPTYKYNYPESENPTWLSIPVDEPCMHQQQLLQDLYGATLDSRGDSV